MPRSPEEVARKRLRLSEENILFTLKMVRAGNPFAGEQDAERRRERLQRKVSIGVREAEVADADILRRGREEIFIDRQEKVWGDTIDFVNVAFLERGAKIARSVGRVSRQNGKAVGSGVLIGERLFLTNHHVIHSPHQASGLYLEFDYERDLGGALREPTRFELDTSIFITDPVEGLDFTVVGVGTRANGPETLEAFGLSALSSARDKHMVGEFANIVQHPQGRLKEVVLRENRLVNRFEDCLHYVADTEPGSSGSPVYNSEWQIIALHHWGGPWISERDGGAPSFDVNEGIRISSIVRMLRNRMRRLPDDAQRRLERVLDLGVAPVRLIGENASPPLAGASGILEPSARMEKDGRVTWTLPLEISVRLPNLVSTNGIQAYDSDGRYPQSAQTYSERDDYSDRKGYLPDFLDGFTVPLPALGPGIKDDAAQLIDPRPGANPVELKYHHFSVVINKRRKLAFYTACIIDGSSSKSIGRRSRNISDLQATDRGLAEAVASLSDAEGESWASDPRISEEDYSGVDIYEGQKVPGFPNPRSSGRIARMFQKGHLVRRLDPAWGDETRALEAEQDTFHYTNAAPQVGFFNQGRADEDQPGTGNGKLWRAAENYVLRNAVAEDQKVISFTGPIFNDDDRLYRNIRIPARFFKVTVWVEQGKLCSLALIVDQSKVYDTWPENIGTPEFLASAGEAEAFQDPDELARVSDFLSTVEEVEKATELDFGTSVRNADVRKGQTSERVTVDTVLPLSTSNVSPS
ncbi:DNA/RNA non-specific endonuclease [bacterium]|nr:DNA/RNA non-specific endonuclease [bacterium]